MSGSSTGTRAASSGITSTGPIDGPVSGSFMTQDGGNLFPVLPNNNNNAGNPAGAGGSSTAYGTSVGGGSGNAATTAKVDVAAPATATNTVESASSVTGGGNFGTGFNKSPPPPLPPPQASSSLNYNIDRSEDSINFLRTLTNGGATSEGGLGAGTRGFTVVSTVGAAAGPVGGGTGTIATATNTVESALSVTAGRSKFGVGFNKSPPPPLPPPHSAPPPQRFKTPDFDISGLRPAVESKRPILLDGG